MFNNPADQTNQSFCNLIMMLGQKGLAGKTLTEYEVLLYEQACNCAARFAEARTLDLEANIRKHYPEARAGREQTDDPPPAAPPGEEPAGA